MEANQKSFIDCTQPLPFSRTSKRSLDILSSLRSTQIASALVAQSQPSNRYNFQLGNQVLSYLSPLPTEAYIDDRSSTSDCYMIVDGYVRLLCQNIHLQRPISADLLGAGAVIGADHLFCAMPLSYRAIAAGPCSLVQIPYLHLIAQLEQSPQLREHLSQIVQQRERLIFFKRFTQQRLKPSRILKYFLLSHLVEQQVYAGVHLFQALSESGYFWLRAGRILSQSNSSHVPGIGDAWGYPAAIPEDWVAQTELTIYKLPLDSWKTLELLYA